MRTTRAASLKGQTGCIGHLRGDFGSGQEFYTSWFDHRREYKTDEFKAEFDEGGQCPAGEGRAALHP